VAPLPDEAVSAAGYSRSGSAVAALEPVVEPAAAGLARALAAEDNVGAWPTGASAAVQLPELPTEAPAFRVDLETPAAGHPLADRVAPASRRPSAVVAGMVRRAVVPRDSPSVAAVSVSASRFVAA